MYQYKVAAINEIGRGALSDRSDAVATPPMSRPGMVSKPTYDNSYCDKGECSFRVKWKTPGTGGAVLWDIGFCTRRRDKESGLQWLTTQII